MAAIPTVSPVAKSSFVLRILEARDDAAKRRIHELLLEIDDDWLFGFGLSPEDIALLRGPQANIMSVRTMTADGSSVTPGSLRKRAPR